MDAIPRAGAALADPVRRLHEFALAERRRALSPAGARLLVVTTAAEAEAIPQGEAFDAAWLAPESLEQIDVAALGRHVARALRSGAPLVCVIPGARPLPTVLGQALLGRGEPPAPGPARLEGGAFARKSPGDWRRAFGPEFAWRRACAIGVLLPPSGAAGWVQRHPIAFGLLAAAEHVMGGWPLLRSLGDRIILEGVRR
jgi:hypothetical protein